MLLFQGKKGARKSDARRWVVIRQHLPTRPKAGGRQPMLFRELEEHREYRYSVLVTHDTALAPEEIWRTYRPRANEENAIKEMREGYGGHEFNVDSAEKPIRNAICNDFQGIQTQGPIGDRAAQGILANITNLELCDIRVFQRNPTYTVSGARKRPCC